jgi:hypothetical protein
VTASTAATPDTSPHAAPGVTRSQHHHGSHRDLLTSPVDVTPADVDAIIVPTARPAAYLRTAIALAKELDCALVALCSRLASADVTTKLGHDMGIETVAIDVSEVPLGFVPRFGTSALLRPTKFNRRSDTSLKRNLGLSLAHAAGWERVVFLDDDITVPRADDLRDAAGLVDRYAGVGLAIGGFPDNSVVCHAYREGGGAQDTFIGGGALAIGSASFDSFFPNIYNEDWFFLLDETGLRPSAVTGRAIQSPYDPYRETMRARSEELGDCLAEGLFWLLDHGSGLSDANVRYWSQFLQRRRRFIDEVVTMVCDSPINSADKVRMAAALRAAKGRNWLIDPLMCVEYLAAWRADRKVWSKHMSGVRRMFKTRRDIEKVLAVLGLMHRYRPKV